MTNNYSIEVNNLTKRFGSFTSVDNISFNVKQGEIFGFLGANGAGKSTTIRMLCGIISPTEGEAHVAGYSINKNPEDVKNNIGYMSQKFSLYNDLTVEENINFFGGVYGIDGTQLRERKEWVLGISNLKGQENLLTGSLPGGIKQRLALGTAVIHRPKIVFLDEPTSGVDPISRRNFWDLIHFLSNEGTTVFVTTHYLEEAEYCANIILIDAGKLTAEGNSQKLKHDYIKGKILELECSDEITALELLENQPFIDEASIFGKKIHLIVNNQYKSTEQLNDFLTSQHSIEIFRVDQIIPTLEDVFVYLLSKKGQND